MMSVPNTSFIKASFGLTNKAPQSKGINKDLECIIEVPAKRPVLSSIPRTAV